MKALPPRILEVLFLMLGFMSASLGHTEEQRDEVSFSAVCSLKDSSLTLRMT